MKRLFLLLAICLPVYLFAQGFGSYSHDQPYLAKDNETDDSGGISDTNLYAWWHAGDLSNGIVSVWTDRLLGLQLTNVLAYEQPSANGIYVNFVPTNRLYVSLPVDITPFAWSLAIIFKNDGQDDNSNMYMLGFPPSVNPNVPPGFVTARLDIINRATFTVLQTEVVGAILDWPDVVQNHSVSDYVLAYGGGTTVINYTNGVAGPIWTGTFLNWDRPVNFVVGAGDDDASYGGGFEAFNGRIYDIFVYSNTVPISTATNLHYYRTNTYGL